ncbi:solute carrier family 35 member F2 isoform X4 [Mirounga angustirostris]|uniref:solute carrier family 35 member F2 isoform X4 n=1 Tax=Mirounga angustirostris TaxID=9716 RepID=UPI00313CB1C9
MCGVTPARGSPAGAAERRARVLQLAGSSRARVRRRVARARRPDAPRAEDGATWARARGRGAGSRRPPRRRPLPPPPRHVGGSGRRGCRAPWRRPRRPGPPPRRAARRAGRAPWGACCAGSEARSSPGSDVLIGDILVLLGASLYAVSNVCEEYIVKKLSRQEFLGMVGLFGTIISGIQLLIVEYKDIAGIRWDWKIALLFVAFALCMFCLYSFMPLVIKVTSATSVNLGILTADLYSLFFGLFLFGYKFSGLYILSFSVIMVGFILYCSTPTRTAEPAESSVPPVTGIGIDNLGLKLEENLQETHSAAL